MLKMLGTVQQPRVELRFLIEAERITVQNDGLPFSIEDAKAICRAAASSKRHDPKPDWISGCRLQIGI